MEILRGQKPWGTEKFSLKETYADHEEQPKHHVWHASVRNATAQLYT